MSETLQQAGQSNDNIVSKNENKIITRAKAPFKGKRFRSLEEQDAYIRKIFSTKIQPKIIPDEESS